VSNNGLVCPIHRRAMTLLKSHSGEFHHRCTVKKCTVHWNPMHDLFYLTDSENWMLEEVSQPKQSILKRVFRASSIISFAD
jgi:hypothetical protein